MGGGSGGDVKPAVLGQLVGVLRRSQALFGSGEYRMFQKLSEMGKDFSFLGRGVGGNYRGGSWKSTGFFWLKAEE